MRPLPCWFVGRGDNAVDMVSSLIRLERPEGAFAIHLEGTECGRGTEKHFSGVHIGVMEIWHGTIPGAELNGGRQSTIHGQRTSLDRIPETRH